MLGTDASGFDPDGQLPPIPETNASKSGRQRLVDLAARDKLTVRQLAQRVGGYGGVSFLCTGQNHPPPKGEWVVRPRRASLYKNFPFPPGRADRFLHHVGGGLHP